MTYFADRSAETELECPECGQKLRICRNCFTVFMNCNNCKKKFPLKDFLSNADSSMEKFLENLYIDRI